MANISEQKLPRSITYEDKYLPVHIQMLEKFLTPEVEQRAERVYRFFTQGGPDKLRNLIKENSHVSQKVGQGS